MSDKFGVVPKVPGCTCESCMPREAQGSLVEWSGSPGPATVYPVTVGERQPCTEREPEPSIVDRLRAMAAGEMAAAKHGTRVEKAVARAVARAYREAAEMIEEEA